MLEAKQLRKSYRDTEVLHGVDLHVAPGQVVGLLGANGAGKTTTIKQLAGIVEPSSGEALVGGRPTLLPAARADIGYLPEESALYDEQNAISYLTFFSSLYGMRRQDGRRRAEALLERLDLGRSHWKQPMATFSKGMRRKVAIARTLLHDPAVVILDEPTSGLDPFTAREVSDFVIELRAQGKAILLTAHNLQQVEELCDHIVILKDGRVITEGTLDDLRAGWGQTTYRVKATRHFEGSEQQGQVYERDFTELADVEAALAQVREVGGEVLEVDAKPPGLEEILRKAATE